MLAILARSLRGSSYIGTNTDPAGILVSSHMDMLNTFRDFYADVYASKVSPTLTEIRSFLEDSQFPQLPESDTKLLNAPPLLRNDWGP